jgi:AcrR family transcriptional regulator
MLPTSNCNSELHTRTMWRMADETAPLAGRQRRSAAAERRREREGRIIAATRELFDQRGVRDAQIEDVARAVGINRAIIYRHFTGKEELFALTQVDYLVDLEKRLADADDESAPAPERLRLITEAFVDFGITYPAFVDCGVTILRMGPALLDELSQSALFRLGKGMTDCLARVTSVIEAGCASGDFEVDDVDLVANMLYALGLGGLQLARLGVMVREGSPGVPVIASLDLAQVKGHLVASSLALVGRP